MGFWQFLNRRRYSFDSNRPIVDLETIRNSKDHNDSPVDQEDSSDESSTPPPAPRRRRTGLDISRAYVDPQSEWQERAVGIGTTFACQLASINQLEGIYTVRDMKWSKWYRGRFGLQNELLLIKSYKSDEMSSFEIECMYREIKLLQSLKRCEGIVDVRQLLEENSGTRLVFDGRVQFLDHIVNMGQIPLSARDVALGIIKPVLVGMGYLHSAGIMVRNLREQTIVVGANGAAIANLFLHADKYRCFPYDRASTLEYGAPEVLDKPLSHEVFQMVMERGIGENDLPTYDMPSDIWCVGVLTYKLLAGCYPFQGNTPEQVMNDQRQKLASNEGRRTLPAFLHKPNIPPLAKSFIWECLRLQPEDRKTADQLLVHPWIQSLLQAEGGNGKDFPALRNLVDTSLGCAMFNRKSLLGVVNEL
eukprot:TRINITY_DN14785_c0_g2_i2.p1 TRINITY_DN14785_c0_g2~~TRINITY_DN14785_c0_g2_i2.p1  ORF type:complete len:418 (-),score=40.05 TRINITY_DN14785_c0_g2_i2:293-1546(-)